MFTKKTAPLDYLAQDIRNMHLDMGRHATDSDEYKLLLDRLVTLYSLKEDNSRSKLSGDVKATIAANLVGIVMLMNHERAHVITTKALSFLPKLAR
jgi:hypothetical protein